MAKHRVQEAPSLLIDVLRQFTNLVQGELKLARAEMSGIISRAGVGLLFLAVALLMALVALNVLATAAVAYVAANGISVGMAALLVGGALLLFAIGFAIAGKARLSPDALTPETTVENLRKDVSAIKEATHV